MAALVEEAGITFCFAPDFHPSMRFAAPVRKQLAIPTVFNALGPLTNPARPTAQAVGVADARLLPLIAGVLARRGGSALVFRGDDGLDELSVTTTSTVLSVEGEGSGRNPSTPATSASRSRPSKPCGARTPRTTRRWPGGCSCGEERGPVRDAVLLSAGAALAAAEPARDRTVTERLRATVAVAAESLDSGAAQAVLERWVRAAAGHAAAPLATAGR